MSITLTPEQETRLKKRAEQTGKTTELVLDELFETLPEEINKTNRDQNHTKNEAATEHPLTNRELHARLLAEGLLGDYGDTTKTAQEVAEMLRAETWKRSGENARQ